MASISFGVHKRVMTKSFKPSFKRTKTFQTNKTFDPVRERDQRMHKTEEWKRFSRKYLSENPECYTCGEKSEVTDHIEPSKGRQEVFEKEGNFLPLCSLCHNTVTGKFDVRFTIGSNNYAKVKWLNEERAKNQVLKNRTFLKPRFVKYRES